MPWLNTSLMELSSLKIPRANGSVGLELRGLGDTLISRSPSHNVENTEWTFEWWQIIPKPYGTKEWGRMRLALPCRLD